MLDRWYSEARRGWLPARLRRALSRVQTASTITLVALMAVPTQGLFTLPYLAKLALLALLASSRPARRLIRRHARRKGTRIDDFATLATLAPRTVVILKGRARAHGTVDTIRGGPAIAVRQFFELERPRVVPEHAIRDAARSFTLVDERGHDVWVEVADAELVFDLPRARWLTAEEQLAALALAPPHVNVTAVTRVGLSELAVRDGDRVEVLGVIEHLPDPNGRADYRHTPTRPVLVAGSVPIVLFDV